MQRAVRIKSGHKCKNKCNPLYIIKSYEMLIFISLECAHGTQPSFSQRYFSVPIQNLIALNLPTILRCTLEVESWLCEQGAL